MKSVMVSIKPKWCELIASGQKTIEVRKTAPKEVPFKCYIYETHDKSKKYYETFHKNTIGKVIGEFICNEVLIVDCDSVAPFNRETGDYIKSLCCLDRNDFWDYTHGRCAYGWYISDLKIYDKPRELREFKPANRKCQYSDLGLAIPTCKDCDGCALNRPPQSWMYVEVEG